MKTDAPGTEKVYGTWKGFYGTENEINAITIKINPESQAEIFCDFNDACLITAGKYKLVGDTAIVISCLLTEKKSSEVILLGNLNRTSSFIDGEWNSDGKESGCFYLQKQPARVNY